MTRPIASPATLIPNVPGQRVRGFRTEIPTLEDVFLKLTGHGIRD